MEIAKSGGAVPATLANAFLELDDCLAQIIKRLEAFERRMEEEPS